jgi:predicted phage baseplate assembly protein
LGELPDAGTAFRARYRIGNGRRGNVGAGAICVLVHRNSDLRHDILRVRNPLPAQGGTAPEPMSEAKLNAPYAFRVGSRALRRAITADDYARIAERHQKLQRAAARLTWTGSWFEAAVAVDVRAAATSATERVLTEVEADLERHRRIGHDLDTRRAKYVPIDLGLRVCVAPEHLRGHVKAALLGVFSNRTLPGGRLGLFHPDSLTFGDDIYVSRLIAVAQAVPGVASVEVTRLHRQFEPPNRELENGVLPLGSFEIAQLDNDPNYPDRGRLEITLAGGR